MHQERTHENHRRPCRNSAINLQKEQDTLKLDTMYTINDTTTVFQVRCRWIHFLH